jgi:hypothetical protein
MLYPSSGLKVVMYVPTAAHDIATQKNTAIVSAVTTSDLTA